MHADAFAVLEAISRGARADDPESQRWIEAFKTIRWAVDGREGPVLTAEGRRARDQMALERRGQVMAAPLARQEQPRRAASA